MHGARSHRMLVNIDYNHASYERATRGEGGGGGEERRGWRMKRRRRTGKDGGGRGRVCGDRCFVLN